MKKNVLILLSLVSLVIVLSRGLIVNEFKHDTITPEESILLENEITIDASEKKHDNISMDAIIKGDVEEHAKTKIIDKKDTIITVLGYETDSFYIVEDVMKDGEVISNILKEYNLNINSHKLDEASKDIFNVRNMQKDKEYTVICSKDSNKIAKCFVYHESETKYVVFDFTKPTINVYKGEKEITIKNNTVSGTIKKGGSVWRCLARKLNSEKFDPLVDILANRIYAWTFDFTHIQPGDSFIVHFEELYVKNECVGIGKILAASFTHKGKTTNAFRFKESGSSPDYFDEKGNNLRSAFLVSPFTYTRISSSFGKRKHPISGKWKNHNGTDYSASTGTPVMTTASGTVTSSGWERGYGNCVRVKHNDKFSTLYAHLSRFNSGARKGAYVKQGDVIGYVGSTGFSTAPHLHYEFFVHGKQVNHLKQELPPSLPLKKENEKAFQKVMNEYLKILENFVK